MKQYLLKYFAWISLGLIAFSCRSPEILLSGEQSGNYQSSYGEKKSFKATVLYKDAELAGIVLIKKDTADNYRVAFYNEMGMTFLEGTMDTGSGKNKLVVHNIIPALDNKPFLRNFEKSLRETF